MGYLNLREPGTKISTIKYKCFQVQIFISNPPFDVHFVFEQFRMRLFKRKYFLKAFILDFKVGLLFARRSMSSAYHTFKIVWIMSESTIISFKQWQIGNKKNK